MGKKHSYKDYNITVWLDFKDDLWEFLSVVSGPMNSSAYQTVNVTGTSSMPTAEEAYERAQEAAIKHIDSRLAVAA